MADLGLIIPYFLSRRLKPTQGVCSVCGKHTKRVQKITCKSFYPGGLIEPLGEFTFCKKCESGLRQVEQIAAEALEQMEHLFPDAVKRWMIADNLVKFSNPDWDVVFPLKLFNILVDARRSFLLGFLTGSIVLSSAAVELAINSDARRESYNKCPRENKELKWQMLNVKTLKLALDVGCPVHLLLEKDEIEKDGTIRQKPKPIFIENRNKYAHGERASSFFLINELEEEALDQLLKCQNFIVEWAASEGNPVIASDKFNEENPEIRPKKIMLRAPAASLSIGFFNPNAIQRWY